jgi:hypothetical protein
MLDTNLFDKNQAIPEFLQLADFCDPTGRA